MISLGLFLLVILFITFCICVIWSGRRNYGILENCGFPVIPPTLFLGSDPKFYQDVPQLKDLERYKKHGPIWGLYMGVTPQVFVCDPELIRLIFVKDSDYFHNRREVSFGSPLMNEILDYLPGEKWKTVRSTLSPLFTTSKLKSMNAVITAHAQEYVADLKREFGKNDRIKYECKGNLTICLIDMFTQSTLGIQLENRKDANNALALAFKKMLGEDLEYGFLYSLTKTFHWLKAFAPTFDDDQAKLLESTFRHILESRRDTPETKSKIFIDLLADLMARVDTDEFQKLGITDLTVISQAVAFFLGGYDTTATTISHFLYFVAKNPEVQEKLYEEIMSNFDSTEISTSHENITEEKTPYLTACINETLRLAPPAKADRICTKDWEHGDIQIKKGTEVYVAMFPTQRNPEIFPEPDDFKPERFLPENKAKIHPFAFAAFGFGPRNCVGMRFGYESMKIFLIHFFVHFKIESRPDTKLIYTKGSAFSLGFAPIYLDIVKRQSTKVER